MWFFSFSNPIMRPSHIGHNIFLIIDLDQIFDVTVLPYGFMQIFSCGSTSGAVG